MKESPIIAPRAKALSGPAQAPYFGIQPVRVSTRRGKAEILAIFVLDRMNQESRNRIHGTHNFAKGAASRAQSSRA
jgi:hypothetical protein